MVTFGSLARTVTTAALAGSRAAVDSVGLGDSGGSVQTMQALAVKETAEANIIQPRNRRNSLMIQPKKDGPQGLGLKREDYDRLGDVGMLKAMTRAGGGGLIIDRKV
jgi:hypothetical protein